MKLGFVGLGKMGLNMTKRLLRNGHEVVVFNLDKDPYDEVEKEGAVTTDSLEELVENLPDRKVVWIMVPSGKAVDETVDKMEKLLTKNDIVIDGGNSYFKNSISHGKKLAEKGIFYLDCGTSGGVWGLEEGYCLMSGGEKEPSEYVKPVFETLAPEKGYLYCGKSGSGHYVKMVHNGIEYGMMQAYAEGFEIMERSDFDVDLKEVARVWQYGSVIRSWLLRLIELALKDDKNLDDIKAYVEDSGEGRWTVLEAIESAVPANVIASALFNRFESREDDSYAMKLLAALRNQFGGHEVKKEG